MEKMTREDLRTRVRDDGEYRAPYISPAMVNAFLNAGIRLLHPKLVRIAPERFKYNHDVSIVSGTSSYPLPAAIFRVTGVYLADSSAPSGYVPVPRYMGRKKHMAQYVATDKNSGQYELRGGAIEVYPPPTYTATWRVEYVRAAMKLDKDNDTYDGEDLECEWLIAHALMKCASKSEDDNVGMYKALRDELWQEIAANAEIDDFGPKTVTNVRDTMDRWPRRRPGYSV
jgi:hypothetical protein